MPPNARHGDRKNLQLRTLPRLIAAGFAAFCVYLAMYAFRKPIAVATFSDQAPLWGVDFKTALILAQALGYACSKIIGIRVVSIHRGAERKALILGLIGISWIALVGVALLPAWMAPLCMVLNGLPLGMIWGLVVSYLEGRRLTEVLTMILAASFIVSSGLVKSVGSMLLIEGVSPFWMPAATGLLFAPLLVGALLILSRIPAPDEADKADRGERVAMDAASRRRFVRLYWLPLTLLLAGYGLLVALRDYRDNFAAEMWLQLGQGRSPALFIETEIPVTIVVLFGLAVIGLIRRNRAAMIAVHALIVVGAAVLGLSTIAWRLGMIGPIAWVTLSGTGLYLAYAPFSVILFERIMAFTRYPGNAGFLIYMADAFGYCGSLALMIAFSVRNGGGPGALSFYVEGCLIASVVLVCAAAASLQCFFSLQETPRGRSFRWRLRPRGSREADPVR
jgi:hypothetical protein